MKQPDPFSGCHPLVNFFYFALVLAFTMFLMHPVSLAISLSCAIAYLFCLNGRNAVFSQLRFLLPVVLLAAVANPAFNHEGATLVCGGERHTEGECAKGYFMRPTIFDNCTPDMTIVREEIFGPVVTIQTFKTEEEAIALANDTDYGLAGGVFTHQLERALRVVKEVRAGITWVNAFNPTFNEAPWGGYKMSGVGRELGVHGLEEYQEIKQVNINLTPGAPGWYEH